MNKSSNAAQRMRRLRYRRALGIRVLPVEVSIDVVEVLVEHGYLEPDDWRDTEKVAEAASQLLEQTAEQVTRHGVIIEW